MQIPCGEKAVISKSKNLLYVPTGFEFSTLVVTYYKPVQ